MLVSGRFDYFPRGLNEAPLEYAAQHERHPRAGDRADAVLVSRYPVFFYVSRNNPALAKRLSAGLEHCRPMAASIASCSTTTAGAGAGQVAGAAHLLSR
jgi:hypothetical protein